MLRRIWAEIITGENLDAYLGVISSAILSILSTFDLVSQRVVESALLMLVSLLIIGRIGDRWFFEEMKKALLESRITTWAEVQSEVKAMLSNAQSVWVLAVAPLSFIREYRREIIQICKHGKVNICFVNPDSPAMGIIEQLRPEQPYDAKALVNYCKRLKSDLGQDAHNLSIRAANFIPPAIVSIISDGEASIAFVTFNSIDKVGFRRPTLVIRNTDPLFLFYEEEVKAFWQISAEIV